MNPGDMVLLPLMEAGGGAAKLRPGVLLVHLPGPYQTLSVCGISTRLQAFRPNWDKFIGPGEADFPGSGLHQPSVIRLSFFARPPWRRSGAPSAPSTRRGSRGCAPAWRT